MALARNIGQVRDILTADEEAGGLQVYSDVDAAVATLGHEVTDR